MKVNIYVTQKDIDEGWPGSATSCPVAKAIRRRVDDPGSVMVFIDDFYVGGYSCSLADKACRFRSNFDCGYEVSPIRFAQEIPDRFVKQQS